MRIVSDKKFEKEELSKALISKLRKDNFDNTIDEIGNFGKGNDLYFKEILPSEYLVLNHYSKSRTEISGFDLWIANFDKRKNIGSQKAKTMKAIKLNFHVNNDYELITNRYK